MRRLPPPLACSSALAGAWRIAASGTAGLAAAVISAWAGTLAALALDLPDPAGGPSTPAMATAMAMVLGPAIALGTLSAAGAWRWLPRGGGRLSYDGGSWWLSRAATSSSPAALLEGHPAIALDLGNWMLLRFHPLAARTASGHGRCSVPGVARRPLWLPIAAASDPPGWPALRAALWTWRPGRDPSPTPERAPRR